jgi:DNA repair and recombination protein RAD52
VIGFSDDQKKLLSDKLESKHVKPPSQYGPKGDYLEGWHVIAEANRIFGFDGWSYEVMEAKCVSEAPRKIGKQQKDGWGVTYTAKVRVVVAGVMREDFGAGHGYDLDAGLAHESAIKEAVTDSLKRALRTFGNPFGLALYDKTRENVEVSVPEQQAQASAKPASKAGSRETYTALEKDMRKCQTTGDLARWWKDAECVRLRKTMPEDWQRTLHDEFTKLGFDLKRQEDNDKPERSVVDDIQDTFPGSTVVDERVLDHPLMAGE